MNDELIVLQHQIKALKNHYVQLDVRLQNIERTLREKEVKEAQTKLSEVVR